MLGVASERAVESAVENVPRLFHFRKQPVGHIWQPYDDAERAATGCYGAKTYFFSAVVINPYETIFASPPSQVSPKGGFADFGWLRKEEVCEKVSDKHLSDYLGHLLC